MKQKTAMQMQESATLKAGQGSANGHVQIEEQKIDDVTVEEAIGQVAKDAGHQASQAQHVARDRAVPGATAGRSR